MTSMNLISESLNKISITHLCDASDKIRIMDLSIKSIGYTGKMIGKAFTVQSHGDLLSIMNALDIADPGSVLVISGDGSTQALAGEIFSTVAKKRGLSGIVIDGYCRDVMEIRGMQFPLYAKGVYPRAGTKEKAGELQCDIFCAGVKVLPGEIIFGDENGIVVLSESELETLLPLAIKNYDKEQGILQKIKAGAVLGELFNFKE
jgi:4-hydroxy-4-methyl-2-oxoglutarate aldolase